MPYFHPAQKISHNYIGKVNGKHYVVPHSHYDMMNANQYASPLPHKTVTSLAHIEKHNPSLEPHELDLVHRHINAIHRHPESSTVTKEEYDYPDPKPLTTKQTKKKEEIVHSMKKNLQGFKERYGNRAKNVMYATATKQAKHMAEEYGVLESLDEASNFMTTYKRNESQNRHTANVVHLAKHFGTKAEQEQAKFYHDELKKHGHQPHHVEVGNLHMKLYNRMKGAHTPHTKTLKEETKKDNRYYTNGKFDYAKFSKHRAEHPEMFIAGVTAPKSKKKMSEQYMKEAPPAKGKENEFPEGTSHEDMMAHHIKRYNQYAKSPNKSEASHEAMRFHRDMMGHHGRYLSEELHAYNVYHNGKHIDKVFYGQHHDPEEVKKSLVHHDDYDPGITVKKERKGMKESVEHSSTYHTVKSVLSEMMTRKHFQQVADVIRAHPDPKKRQELAHHHAEIFKKSNPRFDKRRFFTAALGFTPNPYNHRTESVEPLNELKKSTLASYIEKAAPSLAFHAYTTGRREERAIKETDPKLLKHYLNRAEVNKKMETIRKAGIRRAARKLKVNE